MEIAADVRHQKLTTIDQTRWSWLGRPSVHRKKHTDTYLTQLRGRQWCLEIYLRSQRSLGLMSSLRLPVWSDGRIKCNENKDRLLLCYEIRLQSKVSTESRQSDAVKRTGCSSTKLYRLALLLRLTQQTWGRTTLLPKVVVTGFINVAPWFTLNWVSAVAQGLIARSGYLRSGKEPGGALQAPHNFI